MEFKQIKNLELSFDKLKEDLLKPFQLASPQFEDYGLALELNKIDHNLEPADALHIAMAINNKAKFFVTLGEKDLISNEKFVKFWGKIVDNVAYVNMLNRWDSYNNNLLDNNRPCDLLWERTYVWFDGMINPCDYDYKSLLNVGSIKDSSIKEIWTGKKYNKLREGHLKGNRRSFFPCDRCEF